MSQVNPDAPVATPTDLLAAALDLVASEGWRTYSPLRLAQATGIGLAEACLQLPDQASLLRALGRRADIAMLDVSVDDLAAMTPKERLFELLMRRFDALEPARPALRRLQREGPPQAWLQGLGNVVHAVKLVVEATDAAAPGRRLPAGGALASAYLGAGRAWLQDESPDKAATMAELDKRLDSIARFLR